MLILIFIQISVLNCPHNEMEDNLNNNTKKIKIEKLL